MESFSRQTHGDAVGRGEGERHSHCRMRIDTISSARAISSSDYSSPSA